MTCPRTCAEAVNIVITQELLDGDFSFSAQLGEKRTIDGKDIAVVFVKNSGMEHALPFLQCACDFHYEEQELARMHHIDTHACERKKAWYRERWSEVALEYNKKGLSPREIILDIFDRVVNKSEFLGQTQGDWIYVQHLGEVFLQLDHKVWGNEEYPLKKDSTLYKGVCVRLAQAAFLINKDRPSESHWHPEAPTMTELAVTHALDVVQTLIDEKKLSLMGMVLTRHKEPPPEVLDEARMPMLSWEAKNDPETPIPGMLVWMVYFKKRLHAEVQRTGEHTATLCLFYRGRKGKPDRLLKTWKVTLSYGAQFGPDVSDIAAWRDMLKKFIYSSTKRVSKK